MKTRKLFRSVAFQAFAMVAAPDYRFPYCATALDGTQWLGEVRGESRQLAARYATHQMGRVTEQDVTIQLGRGKRV